MMKRKILIADDESRMRRLISDFLKRENYEIIEASDGDEAIDLFLSNKNIDLVILDVMMPGSDGWEVCEYIRELSNIPIIMLTAKVTENDELHGFTSGADEYITKPFSPLILVARVNALIKRTYGNESIIVRGILTLDLEAKTIIINNKITNLSSTELKLLEFLIKNESKVISREILLDNIWGFDYDGTARTVDTHMNRLRIKLAEAGDYLVTARGYGYKFEVV
ncbi:MAG: response regulator transcription factor [Clostridiales bacterium]|nr:response regulator transcription factor [Clostridiales bacterium]